MNKIKNVVIINGFDTYEHRVELLKTYFVEKDCNVKIITSDWMHFHKRQRANVPEGYEMIHVKPYYKNISADRLMSHYDFAKNALQRVEELQPQLLWVLVPPNSLVKCAASYKKKFPNVKLVYDFIDMWPETMPISRFKTLPPFLFWKNLRDKHVQYGDAVVTECDLYHKLLYDNVKQDKLHTLYLARKTIPSSYELNLPKNKISLCYLGSINNIIDIRCVGDIIKKIDMPVDLHIIGDGEKKDELIKVSIESGANVIFHGKIYNSIEKMNIFSQCHFGLNIMKETVFVGLTMKSMDYFEYGLPIINNIKGDTWDFVEKFKIGLNIGCSTEFQYKTLADMSKCREDVRRFFEEYLTYDVFEMKLGKIMDVIEGKDNL